MKASAVLWNRLRRINEELKLPSTLNKGDLRRYRIVIQKALFQPTEKSVGLIWDQLNSALESQSTSKNALKDLIYWRPVFDEIVHYPDHSVKVTAQVEDDPLLQKLEEALGVNFLDKSLLRDVFLFISYLRDHPDEDQGSNEKLEFLGDSVIAFAVTQYVYTTFVYPPVSNEIASLRDSVVRGPTLSRISRDLGLGDYVLKGYTSDYVTNSEENYILTCALEALIGALFLDQGIGVVSEFVSRVFRPYINRIVSDGAHITPKGHLWRLSREIFGEDPKYKITPNYVGKTTIYIAEVYINKNQYGKGNGNSRLDAQISAAQVALDKLKLIATDQRAVN